MIIIPLSKEVFFDVAWFERYNYDKETLRDADIEIDEITQELVSIKSKQIDSDGNSVEVVWHKDNGFKAKTRLAKKRIGDKDE